jgi:hypothetical protein
MSEAGGGGGGLDGPGGRLARRARRPRPETPSHREWDVLQALLAEGQRLEAHEAGGSLRCVLPAGVRPTATPVPPFVFTLLLGKGWLARTAQRRAEAAQGAAPQAQDAAQAPGQAEALPGRVTAYRLSLRGWYAVRRLRPGMAGNPPVALPARTGQACPADAPPVPDGGGGTP